MKIISNNDVQDWYAAANDLGASFKTIGLQSDEVAMPEMPFHLQVPSRI